MIIDLRKCIGCGTCAVACSRTNSVPFNYWRRVFDCGVSGSPERRRLYLPISCMHCSNAPCIKVCPTGASQRDDDGIVRIDYTKCAGCGYCVVACPYVARTVLFENGDVFGDNNDKGQAEKVGVCTKCDFCAKRVREGLARGIQPGIDPEASPACVASCPAGALSFGDLEDIRSVVARCVNSEKTLLLQETIGTEPSVYYLVDDDQSS